MRVRSPKRAFYAGPPTMPHTTDDARPAGMSCRSGTVEKWGPVPNNVGQCAHHRKGWKDARVTQAPTIHSTSLAPGMLIQSTPSALTHLPHNSTFCLVSMHSNVASSPEVGALGALWSPQRASRRTRRDCPEAAPCSRSQLERAQAMSITDVRMGRAERIRTAGTA